MAEEIRFQTGFRGAATAEPGLVMHLDGSLWVVAPDGTETPLGAGSGGGGLAIYGSGTDGDHVCEDGDTIHSGMYRNFTIPEGVTVNLPAGEAVVLFCTDTYTIDGAIDMTGIDAINRLAVGQGDATSGAGSQGTGGSPTVTYGTGNLGGRGGRGAAGTGGTPAALAPKTATENPTHLAAFPPNLEGPYPGGGGGGGGGDSTNYGGGGGSGGRQFAVIARHVVHGELNQYLVQGGNGADGGDDGSGSLGHGTCGGGGGGGAGWWITVSDDIAGSDAFIIGAGGAGGAACGDSSSSASLVSTADIIFPLTITVGVNDEFRWNGGNQFAIIPGTYNDPGDLIVHGIMPALLVGDPEFRTFAEIIPMTLSGEGGTTWTPVDIGGTKVSFESPYADGGGQYNGTTIDAGDHDALPDLNFDDGQAASGGTDGSTDGLPGADGYVIHILNA